jgi:2-methylcitrate dehydratase PrpD
MDPTETLAQFVVDTYLRDISSKAVEISKLVILDVLGVTLAAARQPVARILNEHLRAARR